jgi:hypothetical protein
MNAPANLDRYALNIAEARALVSVCEREMDRRKLAIDRAHPFERAGLRRFMHILADVQYAALGVIDRLEGAQEALSKALDAADYHPLHVAIQRVRDAEKLPMRSVA